MCCFLKGHKVSVEYYKNVPLGQVAQSWVKISQG